MNVLLTSKDTANMLRISESMLKKMRARGAGPVPLRIGARVLYDQSEVEMWAREQLRAAYSRRSRSRTDDEKADR